jgi:serine protease
MKSYLVKNTARRALVVMAVLGCVLIMGAPLCAAAPPATAPASQKTLGKAAGAQDFAPNEVVVKFKSGAGSKAVSNTFSELGATRRETNQKLGFMKIRVPSGKTVQQTVDALNKLPIVEYAEPNYVLNLLWTPNDPRFPDQWHFDNPQYGGIGMKAAWDVTRGNPDVVVAVVDTGVAYENYTQGTKRYYQAPDLAQTSFVPGYDYVNNDTHPNDDNCHGTHVTGTVAQSTNNALGVAGIASGCSIMPVKVLSSAGSGTATQIANGITFAADHGAHVINMSLGTTAASSTIENAVKYAYQKGVVIVCAAGNNAAAVNYPAAYDAYCIAVGATKYDEVYTSYSSYGASLDLAAPGGNTGEDLNGDGYGDGVLQQTFNPSTKNTSELGYYYLNGTSMASPHVAGVAALVISKYGLKGRPDSVRNILQATAEDKGTSGWDTRYGHGLVNAVAAVSVPGPRISSISPSSGNAGTIVTLNGFLFGTSQGTSSVSFGGVPATEYVSWSDSKIVVKVPAGVSGQVGVTVKVGSSVSNAVPFLGTDLGVLSISPNSVTQGSTNVSAQVTGFGFAPGATVRLEMGGSVINASSNTFVSSTQVNCTFSFAGAQTGGYDVLVSSGGKEARLAGGLRVSASSGSACGSGAGFSALLGGLMLGLLSAAGTRGLARRRHRL